MSDTKNIDIALIVRMNDENGNPYMRTLEDGKKVPDPMIFTQNYGDTDGVRIRVSLWDLDKENLYPLLPESRPNVSTSHEEEFEEFFLQQHSRMQDLVSQGVIQSRQKSHSDRQRIEELEHIVRKNGRDKIPSNVN